ncbi:MAG: Dabb family protein [Deltaproteobacteria bacterium]
MICHVVLYKMKSSGSDADKARLMAAVRQTLPTLPGVRNLRVGKSLTGPEKGYSVALVMDFEDAQALETYRVDARHHQFVKEVAGPLVEDIWRFDFEWN